MENKFKLGDDVVLIGNPSMKMGIISINLDGTYKCKWKVSNRMWLLENYSEHQLNKFAKPKNRLPD